MRPLFLAVLLGLIPLQQEPRIVEREEPDLVVRKFTWNKLRENSGLIHSPLDPGPAMNEPIRIAQPPRQNEPNELKNRRDMNERRAQMVLSERSASQSSAPKHDQYFLRLEVKNVGANIVKNIVWEYQPPGEPTDYELRQFICTMKAKPNETKTFELVSPISPVKVVQADAKTGEAKDGKVVINRIEYADGSIWKRKGWSVLIPPDIIENMGYGKCLMF